MSQSGRSPSCVAFMPDDIEAFIECRGIEVRRDIVEVSLRCPFRARRESKFLASLLQLTLTKLVRCHDEVKLMVGPRGLRFLSMPDVKRRGRNDEVLLGEDGKPIYDAVLGFSGREARDRFNQVVLEALRAARPELWGGAP